MNEWKEHFISLVRSIGVATYGKERWFLQGDGMWYDRELGKEMNIDVLKAVISEEIKRCS